MNLDNIRIPLFLDDNYVQKNLYAPVYWEPDKACHILCCGSSGSGKSYASILALGTITYFIHSTQLYIANYKGDSDFSFLDGSKRYYCFDQCGKAIDDVYQLLLARQRGTDKSRNLVICFFDEFTSWVMSLDKKTADAYKTKINILLMLSRSFCINLFFSVQRADSAFFPAGAREQFGVMIGLGNLSKESKSMLFHEVQNYISDIPSRGIGYMTTNGTDLKRICVPTVNNITKLHKYIYKATVR